jgi:hypothetical protein
MSVAPPATTAESRRTGAAVALFGTIASYKLVIIGLGHPLAWVTGLSIDVAFVGLLWLGAVRAGRSRLSGARWMSAGLYWPLLLLWFASAFGYTYFHDAAAGRHYSLLNVSLYEVAYFFRDLLPLTGWLQLGALILVGVVSAVWCARRITVGPLVVSTRVTALVVGAACTLGWNVPDVPSPLMDIARDLHVRLSEHAIAPVTSNRAVPSIALFDKSATDPAPLRPQFTKIVVIVMETMAIDTYRQELAALPPGNMLRTLAAHAHSVEQYYTANQDSRTAMLDMLLSRFIPYEAYDDATFPSYEHAYKLSNLPALLHEQGYATAYALAQEDREQVVAELPWQQVISLTPPQIAALKPHALCFNPFEFENSCEDKVLLPDVVRFLAAHDRAFVYQEMMWGHDLEYNKASGKGNVQYVGEYVDSLWKELGRRGLADRTLLVLTGDHGDKEEDRLRQAVNYQVPMFFYASQFSPRHVRGMYTHLDFKNLLLRELDPRRAMPAPTPFVQVVGPTNSLTRVVVDSAGGLVQFKERSGTTFVTFASAGRPPEASVHLRMYEDYRRWWEQMVPRK